VNKKSKKLEEKAAKDFSGGKTNLASGALPFWKQDITSDNFLIEHKYTEPWTKGFAIKRRYFADITNEAFKLGKLPMMIIEFTGNPEVKVAVIRYEDAIALDKLLNSQKEQQELKKETNGEELEGAS
jgi:hypothetical protein